MDKKNRHQILLWLIGGLILTFATEIFLRGSIKEVVSWVKETPGVMLANYLLILMLTSIFFLAKRKYMVYFFLMIVLSYTVVIQPAYDPPEDEIITEEGMEELTPDNTYVQKEGDKYYMIYKNDKDELSKEEAEELKMSGYEEKENAGRKKARAGRQEFFFWGR